MSKASSPQLIWVTEPDDSIALVLLVPFGACLMQLPDIYNIAGTIFAGYFFLQPICEF